jgi:hypothetical protein
MTTITAKVIEHSVSRHGIELATLQLRFPRFVLAEFNTHRVFSRNARSSRAVPVERMIQEIETDPVIPLHWGANQKGMQASQECDAEVEAWNYLGCPSGPFLEEVTNREAWLLARDWAVDSAKAFAKAGYHKQVVNRLLEPFMHIDVLVSSTNWSNFLALRDHPDAEPHIAILAREIRAALDGSTPWLLQPGDWHLPYISTEERNAHDLDTQRKLSVARCARISYTPFDGNGSIDAELARYESLVGSAPIHASPCEHQATPDYRIPYAPHWKHADQHRNFRGWRQFRAMIPCDTL